MNFADIETADLVVFVALAKALVRADQVLSDNEIAYLGELAETVGTERFEGAVAEADATIGGIEAALEAAASVADLDVRRFLHGQLESLAASDQIVANEATVLSRLAEIWLGSEDAPNPLLLR